MSELISVRSSELCQVFCQRVMSSNCKTSVLVAIGSELCQVFQRVMSSILPRVMSSFWRVKGPSGSFGAAHTYAGIVPASGTCALKPSTQPLSCHRESRVFSLYLCWRVSLPSSLAAIPCLRALHPSVLFGITLCGQLWAIRLALFYIVCMWGNIPQMQTLC